MPIGLYALAIGGFGIGLTEFVIAGLLPEIAAEFGVSEATAGWLISGYAITVAVGAVLVTAATSRLPRKPVLLGLLVLFVVGNALSAVATGYTSMLVGRVVAALCHGAFFGIGAVVAAGMVPKAKRSAALALMFTGLTIANVLGVPLGTLVGQTYGWRATFWVITVVGVVAFAGVAVAVTAPRHERAPSLRQELGAFGSGQVWLSLAVTVLGYGGMFGAFAYIAYTLTGVSGFASGTVPWLLVLFGVGLFVGNWVGGIAADRDVDRTVLVSITALAVVMAAFAALAASPVATVVALLLMGLAGQAMTPGVQTRVMDHAPTAPTLASGANIAAFNVGNALGAWIGGLTISAGLGYTAPLWAGSASAVAAALVLVAAMAAIRRTAGARSLHAPVVG